jgi:DNA adenine methylase
MATKVVKANIQVVRKSDELGILWGYVSVADIVDSQGDIVPWSELFPAVIQFMEAYYAGKTSIFVNHEGVAEAVLVESTFHIVAGNPAWFVGVKLLSEELRAAARDGEISGFSIGGRAEEVDE